MTIGLTVALAVYRFGPWESDILDGVRQFARLAVVIGGVASWEMATERRRALRMARALALIREAGQTGPP